MGEGEPFRVLQVEGRGIGGVRSHIDAMGRQPHWSTVFAVADADETVAQARQLGAAVVLEPLDLPAIGRVAVLTDPVGAAFQVMATELDAG
jgi:predicted enzyme related to lactoylglutathione lyase